MPVVGEELPRGAGIVGPRHTGFAGPLARGEESGIVAPGRCVPESDCEGLVERRNRRESGGPVDGAKEPPVGDEPDVARPSRDGSQFDGQVFPIPTGSGQLGGGGEGGAPVLAAVCGSARRVEGVKPRGGRAIRNDKYGACQADAWSPAFAFVPRVLFRLKDAIAEEERERRVPDETRRRGKRGSGKARDDTGEAEEASEVGHLTEIQSSAADTEDSEEAEFAPVKMRDTSLLDGVRDTDQEIDVTRILERVCDPRKRLAFHLFMDGVPYKSKHSDVYTVAQALGVSEKTARNWVEEVRQVLRDDERVRFLKQRKEGGGS